MGPADTGTVPWASPWQRGPRRPARPLGESAELLASLPEPEDWAEGPALSVPGAGRPAPSRNPGTQPREARGAGLTLPSARLGLQVQHPVPSALEPC